MPRSVHQVLGATHPAGTDQVTFFLPDRDRDGRSIDQEAWTERVLLELGKLFRGATAFPPGRGVWRNDARGGSLLVESTVIVMCYVPKGLLEKNLERFASFLHLFGREAHQGEVGVIINGTYYGISRYRAR